MSAYDYWKTTNPDDWKPEDDVDCTCFFAKKKHCPVHGKDPDALYDEYRDRQMDKDL